jgi:hypothetical protein
MASDSRFKVPLLLKALVELGEEQVSSKRGNPVKSYENYAIIIVYHIFWITQ